MSLVFIRQTNRQSGEKVAKLLKRMVYKQTTLGYQCVLLLVTALILISGCKSQAIRAGKLPSKFRTAERSNRQTIDFSRVASTGASDAVIAPSDLLEINIATGQGDESTQPMTARVAEDGTVSVPVIGPVPVAGLEAYEASQNIANFAVQRGMYKNPFVTVEIKSKAVNRVTVLGAVNEPGVHDLPRGSSDLISALAASGGLTEEAGTQVEIVRHSQTGDVNNSRQIQQTAYGASPQQADTKTIRIDLSSESTTNNTDYKLDDRDVVRVVPQKKETVYVSGLVRKPGMFELENEQDIHLLDAIALAGGRSSSVADKVYVIRRVENRPEPIVIQASISKAKHNGLENLRLAAGDTITVEQTPTTALVDSVKHFFRLSFGVAGSSIF